MKITQRVLETERAFGGNSMRWNRAGIKKSKRTNGIALVLVLAFLVVITSLVIAFFSSVTTELTATTASVNEITAKQFGDSAVQIAEGQIRTATSRGRNVDWVSQPGMIRTFGTQDSPPKASSQPLAYYKLYSSDNMVVTQDQTGAFNPSDDLDKTWNTKPAVFTDLNEPVTKTKIGSDNKSVSFQVFPILNPAAKASNPTNATDGVEGFNYQTNIIDGVLATGSNQRLPMPVRWIYVLRDGTLTAPDHNSTGTQATFTTAPLYKQPTKDNPIVGRMAFWTDDETSKVNINTASEGVYWDIPRIDSQEDRGIGSVSFGTTASTPGLSLCQPANHEYQRYPGHPATTCLSPIFGWFFGNDPNKTGITAANASQLDPYYEIIPRIIGGGSKGGTAVPPSQPLVNDPLTNKPDLDRLYASIDELVFNPQRTNNPLKTTPKSLTEDVLDKARFFITANSRAPEITLFNTPRVGIWPVWGPDAALVAKRTAFDKLAAFCGTIHNQPFYFSRKNSRSATDDFTGRNVDIYKYLQTLTSTNIPGFGGNFASKYPAGADGVSDCDQILTSIFDYIRCVNLRDVSAGATPYTVAPVDWNATNFAPSAGSGEVIPIKINNTYGFGRYNTISELDLLFYGTPPARQRAENMRVVVLLKFADPMQGNVGYQPNLRYEISGLDSLTIKVPATTGTTKSLNLPPTCYNICEIPDNQTNDGRSLGGIEGPSMALQDTHWNTAQSRRLTASGKNGTRGSKNYPFFSSADVAVPKTAALFTLNAGTITVKIIPDDNPGYTVQTLTFNIPQTPTVSVPFAAQTNNDFNLRLTNWSTNPGGIYGDLIQDEDTVLGMEVGAPNGNDNSAGDYRMYAARNVVPSTFFKEHKNWMKANTATGANGGHAYGMMTSIGKFFVKADGSPLVGNTTYMGGPGDIRQPGVPSRVDATKGVRRADGAPGDWDTGTGTQKDGAYLNKADEGDEQFKDFVNGGPRFPYLSKDDQFVALESIFSPNRQIPSSMMFGSIPTGIHRNQPWQTLLFCPHPEDSLSGYAPHPGKASPPDHLIADLFWMPVVEPYAISEPLSTAGKINLNYQLMPFGAADATGTPYIKRDTALRAVMKATKFMALRPSDATTYKPHLWQPTLPAPSARNARLSIDLNKTLAVFDKKFVNTDPTKQVFKSATEICEMNLIPPTSTDASMGSFWAAFNLTGDNLREKPYADLYGRLTTKSNTYTVHMRAQSLKQAVAPTAPAAQWGQWDEKRDQVLGEYRGSSIVERYIDPNATNITDFATDKTTDINSYYQFRVVNAKQFGQ